MSRTKVFYDIDLAKLLENVKSVFDIPKEWGSYEYARTSIPHVLCRSGKTEFLFADKSLAKKADLIECILPDAYDVIGGVYTNPKIEIDYQQLGKIVNGYASSIPVKDQYAICILVELPVRIWYGDVPKSAQSSLEKIYLTSHSGINTVPSLDTLILLSDNMRYVKDAKKRLDNSSFVTSVVDLPIEGKIQFSWTILRDIAPILLGLPSKEGSDLNRKLENINIIDAEEKRAAKEFFNSMHKDNILTRLFKKQGGIAYQLVFVPVGDDEWEGKWVSEEGLFLGRRADLKKICCFYGTGDNKSQNVLKLAKQHAVLIMRSQLAFLKENENLLPEDELFEIFVNQKQ